jgi:hypothetical protein
VSEFRRCDICGVVVGPTEAWAQLTAPLDWEKAESYLVKAKARAEADTVSMFDAITTSRLVMQTYDFCRGCTEGILRARVWVRGL